MYKPIFEGKKVILFDFDGTIARTNQLWDEAFYKVLAAIGFPNMFLKFYPGMPLDAKWDETATRFNIPRATKIRDLVEQTENTYLELLTKQKDNVEIIEGFWSFGASLKIDQKMKLVLVSNSSRRVITAVLEIMGFGTTFDLVVAGDDVKKAKPNPQIYRHALNKMQVTPKSAMAFEDSIYGVASATTAGIETVVVWDSNTPKDKYPNRNVIGYIPDFTGFSGNLNTSLKDEIDQFTQILRENLEQQAKVN